MKKRIITSFQNIDPSASKTIAAGFALGQEWYNTVTGDKFYHKTDGVWVSVDTSTTTLGLIKIVDTSGFHFTDLATAKAYISTYTSATITNESFSDGTYWFTVPNGTDFSLDSGFLASYDAYIIDELGLIDTFAANAFYGNTGDNVLGDCTFGNDAFRVSTGNNTLGDCTFSNRAFRESTGNNILGNCTFVDSAFGAATGNNILGNCDFGQEAFNAVSGNNILGDCTFGYGGFIEAAGNNILGNCTFGSDCFYNAAGIFRFEDILLLTSTFNFARVSTGRFEIYGNIGTDQTVNYSNFFSGSTAVIWALKAKETSNAGGLEGDLATAQTNGATLFFGYAPTVVEDSISDGVINKAPSQNAVFDALALKLDDPSGIPSQYIRGDGTLSSFPDVAGGGGGQVYYLNGATSQGTIGGTAYVQLSTAANLGTGVDFTSGTVDDVAFANFITDVGKPTQETIPAGVWIFQCYLQASDTTSLKVYATVEVYDGSSFTVLSTSLLETLTGNNTIDLYTFTCAVPEYTPLTTTDRIVIRFYPSNLSSGRTITLHTQGIHLSSVQTTFTTGLATLDGLTSAAQYFQVGTTGSDFNIGTTGTDTHTFNLPTASATNRGALSSSDWTMFNGKLGLLQVTGVTLTAASWSLVSGLYEYTYSNANILSTSIVDAIPASSTISIVKAADILPSTLSATGTVTFYATNAPTGNITVTINIYN
jgi:hypothetical protein